MRDRLLKFMNNEQLSSARFAEIIGVQPSGISHILSGRNKPGFDFIQKVLRSYPALSAEWLIMGRGDMYKREQSEKTSSLQRDLFSDTYKDENEDAGNTGAVIKTGRRDSRVEEIKGDSGEVTDVNSGNATEDYRGELSDSGKITDVNTGRFVKKIVIFYSDNTFASYSPE